LFDNHSFFLSWFLIANLFDRYAICDKKIGNVPSAKEKEESLNILARHMYNRIKSNVNRSWTGYLILIEIYNVIHAAFAIYLTDVFLGGRGSFVTLTIAKTPEVRRMKIFISLL
jgi:hypothetical protein